MLGKEKLIADWLAWALPPLIYGQRRVSSMRKSRILAQLLENLIVLSN